MIIESLEAKDNLAEILAVAGVTGIAIGPGDISMALGTSDWNDLRVIRILTEMADAAKSFPQSGLLRLALTPEETASQVASGVNMILLTHDVQIIRGMYADLFRATAERLPEPL